MEFGVVDLDFCLVLWALLINFALGLLLVLCDGVTEFA